uniref:RNA-binding protein FUS n=1 Tax=Mesocestoides corti TaxID=53468 RepID=A0A5K3EYU3_MESCO
MANQAALPPNLVNRTTTMVLPTIPPLGTLVVSMPAEILRLVVQPHQQRQERELLSTPQPWTPPQSPQEIFPRGLLDMAPRRSLMAMMRVVISPLQPLAIGHSTAASSPALRRQRTRVALNPKGAPEVDLGTVSSRGTATASDRWRLQWCLYLTLSFGLFRFCSSCV